MILLLLFAFLAGIVTILSPCILPILPIILSSSIGDKKIGKSRPLGVVTGFILSFTFFTLFLTTIVQFSHIPPDSLRLVSVIVIALFGFSLLIPAFQTQLEILFSKLSRYVPSSPPSARLANGGQNRTGFWGGLLIGLSIGLLWTPCVGPILASVISLALTGTVTLDSFLITLAYSLGTAIPMFIIMLSGQNALQRIPWLLANLSNIQKIFGVIMILTAIAIFLNLDRRFQTFIITTFPNYGTGLVKFEDNPAIQQQLRGTPNTEDMGKPMFDLTPKGTKAPDLIPGGSWFNSYQLTLDQLRGKVVIIDFWTYTCINCQRTFPYLKSWHDKYKDQGLVIIGVHSPEFEFEKSAKNVEQAIKDFGITYPVVQDNNFNTWRAYDNHYWPAKYFIDKNGYIRYSHFGEGNYDHSEQIIQQLLKETGATMSATINNPTYTIYSKTPETYLGYVRIDHFASPEKIIPDSAGSYTFPKTLPSNQFAISGNWTITPEYATPTQDASLEFSFDSKEVFLVMRPTGNKPSTVKVYLDGEIQFPGQDVRNGIITIDTDRLYKLINLPTPGRHTLRLEFQDSNIQLFAFTFG